MTESTDEVPGYVRLETAFVWTCPKCKSRIHEGSAASDVICPNCSYATRTYTDDHVYRFGPGHTPFLLEPNEAWQPQTAEDFLRKLDIAANWLSFPAGGAIVYRGHSKSAYQLVPGIFRSGGLSTYADQVFEADESITASDPFSIIVESQLLLAFVESCNEACLPLPTDIDFVRAACERALDAAVSAIDELKREGSFTTNRQLRWPTPEVMNTLSLAQHYGVPTRLLDFSDSPLHAAFFASQTQYEDDPKIAVICLNASTMRIARPCGVVFERHVPARFGNANVIAQGGSFIYKRVHYERIVELSTNLANPRDPFETTDWNGFHPAAVKVTLPRSQVQRLATILERRNVRFHTIYPSYSNSGLAARNSRAVVDAINMDVKAAVGWKPEIGELQ